MNDKYQISLAAAVHFHLFPIDDIILMATSIGNDSWILALPMQLFSLCDYQHRLDP